MPPDVHRYCPTCRTDRVHVCVDEHDDVYLCCLCATQWKPDKTPHAVALAFVVAGLVAFVLWRCIELTIN